MSNVLTIRVLEAKELANGFVGLMWIAGDCYGTASSDVMHASSFRDSYPTENDLILNVLQEPAFDGVAVVTGDTYELDACSGIRVEGYRMAMSA
jgi:hypothetical protein